MEYKGKLNEYFLVSTIKKDDGPRLSQFNGDCLRVFWNTTSDCILIFDGIEYVLKQNQILFLTEMHNIDISKINELNLIKFNREFYSSDFNDTEIGCNGVLFFVNSKIPIIDLDEIDQKKFSLLWAVFLSEMESRDNLQGEMLLMLLKRLLILSTRIFKKQYNFVQLTENNTEIIRNFNYLLEINFKTIHSVAEYANLMHKTPKSLANYFKKFNQKTPLKLIQNRIVLEAKRQLLFTDKPIKTITYELGFEDIQSFSRFFKTVTKKSPKEFKESELKI